MIDSKLKVWLSNASYADALHRWTNLSKLDPVYYSAEDVAYLQSSMIDKRERLYMQALQSSVGWGRILDFIWNIFKVKNEKTKNS